MGKKTVSVLHPGEMGAAVGACLAAGGHRVLWVSASRSAATRERAQAGGFHGVSRLGEALAHSDIVLSVCPPHAAARLACEVAAGGFAGLYLDANAIAPQTAREVGEQVEAGGARFVDGGIVGPPPVQAGTSRLFLSGRDAPEIAALFAGGKLEPIVLEGAAGAASALKACYAAWTKGSIALLAAIRALAEHEGVTPALLEEWQRSQPGLARRSEGISTNAYKAWRWIGEMEEIAASFAAAGLPPGFHLAAADLYARLEAFKGSGAPPALDEVLAALRDNKTAGAAGSTPPSSME